MKITIVKQKEQTRFVLDCTYNEAALLKDALAETISNNERLAECGGGTDWNSQNDPIVAHPKVMELID